MADVFFLCLVLGVWTAALALVTPGTGVLEGLCLLLLAAAGIGMLVWPVNPWAFLPLILGGAALILSFVQRGRAGIWLVASAILISVGSILLYEDADGSPAVQPLLAIVMTTLTVAFFGLGVRRGLDVQRAKPTVDAATVIGQIGEARTPVHSAGSVYVGGEMWSARSEQAIPVGARVRVRSLDGLVVEVEPVE
jgi:membrane-bound serine protease (ClpP class)